MAADATAAEVMALDFGTATQDAAAGIDAKVEFLKKPTSYSAQPATVECVETHMAWVFLAGDRAYKLKKPVQYDFLDYRSIAARRLGCLREVTLNRRLAPTVYLDTVPLCMTSNGCLQIGGRGEIVDWLVHMRRLPADLMLDVQIEQGRVSVADIEELGRVLSDFYNAATRVAMTGSEYVQRLTTTIEHDRQALLKPSYGLPERQVKAAAALQLQFLERRADLLEQRVESGRIVDAHGDLRPEHVCLEHPPVVIDCLEFSTQLRTLDMASDLAFLALECELRKAPFVSDILRKTYARFTGDTPAAELLRFYRANHAFSRCKVAVRHLDDAEVNHPDQWRRKASRYLQIATQRYDAIKNVRP